jgi:hypothetical protein
MKTETPPPTHPGPPAWGVAASVGLALMAASVLVVRWAGGPSPRFLPGQSSRGVVSADEAVAARDPVAVDDADEAPRARPTALLASLPKELAPRPAPVVAATPDASLRIERAREIMRGCRDRYRATRDYACAFHKRERIGGKLIRPHVMDLRVRTEPYALYIKFVTPDAGREAIFEPAKHDGKIVYHDVGLGRLIAGTLLLDPRGTLAMDENRHPITDAGIGNLIDMLLDRWQTELDPSEAVVAIHDHARVADRPCTMIEARHTRPGPYSFYLVKVFVDREHNLPIRFEAYDWPARPGGEPELAEEYNYADLKTDVGLTDLDFDSANPRYAFGRF